MRALALLVAAAALPRAAALIVYYNVFSKNVATAVEIVYDPGAGEALDEQYGLRNTRANKRNYTTIMGEWRTLYGAVPPESSLLLRKYRQMYGVPAPGRRLLRNGRATAGD